MTHSNTRVVTHGGPLLSDPSDIAWLLSTHLKGVSTKPFGSFSIVGNEDCPDAIYLYASADPLYTDEAHVIEFLH
jgi:hypothetical protein